MSALNSPQPSSFGRSLQLEDGDLIFDAGDGGRDLAIVAGRDNFLQAMQVMIETPFGVDLFNVNYGFDVLAIMSSAQTVPRIKDLIRLNIVKSTSQDNRVREVKEVAFDDEQRFFDLMAPIGPQRNVDIATLQGGSALPGALADTLQTQRKVQRRWEAVVVLQTINEGDVIISVSGSGVVT